MKKQLLTIRKIVAFLFLLIATITLAQQAKPGQPTKGVIENGGKNPGGNMLVSVGGGGVFPNKSFGDTNYTGNGFGFGANLYVPIVELNNTQSSYASLGFNIGGSFFGMKKNERNMMMGYNITGQTSTPMIQSEMNNNAKRNAFLTEAGVQANFSFSKFAISSILNVGYFSLKENSYSETQTSSVNGQTRTFEIVNETNTKSNGFAFIPKLRLSYFPGKIGFFVEGSYIGGPSSNSVETVFVPNGQVNQEGFYNIEQMLSGTYKTTETKRNFGAFAVNIGISFPVGKSISEKGIKRSEAQAKSGQSVIRTEPTGKSISQPGVKRSEAQAKSGQSVAGTEPTGNSSPATPNSIIAQPETNLGTYTGPNPLRRHTRVYCIDGKKVLRYIDDTGLVYDALYTNLPCNSATWPIIGIEGDLSVQNDSGNPVKLYEWKGDLPDLSNIPKDQMMIPTSQGIQEIIDKINKSTKFNPSIVTDQNQSFLKLVKQQNDTYLTTFVPIDIEGPVGIILGYNYSCKGTCSSGCGIVNGKCAPCFVLGIPDDDDGKCYAVITGAYNFHKEIPVYNFGGIKVDDNGGSTRNPKYAELKKELLTHNLDMINAEIIKEDGNQTLAILVSNGKNPMLLFNKIINGKTTEDWISYYSPDLPNNIPSIKEFLKTNKAGNSKGKKVYVGHLTLLK